MIKHTFLTLFTLLFFLPSFSNNIVDSICEELERITDEEVKLNRYFFYVSELQIHDPNVAFKKAEDYLELANKFENKFHIGAAHYRLGSILHLQTEFGKSMKQLLMAQTIFEEINNQKYIAETDVELSSLYMITGNYEESEQRLEKGINYLNTVNKKERLGDLYFNLGNLKAVREQYDSALYFIEMSTALFENFEDQYGLSRANLSMGSILQMKGDLEKALSYAQKSLKSSKTLEDVIGIQASLTLLGTVYKELGESDSAEYYLLEAHHLDSIVQNSDMTADVSKELSELYEALGNHELSNYYLNEYLELHEDLYNPASMSKLSDIVRNYEVQKKEAQLLEKEIEAAKKKRWLIVSICFLALSIALIWWLIVRSKETKKVQEKQIELYETEQNLLNEILEKRNRELVANSLNLTKKEQILKSVNRELASIKAELAENGIGDAKLRRVMREIRPEVARKSQNLFEKQFIDTHPKFYERIMERSESLTPNERKLCAFLRLNMTTKEIAELTEQSPRAVEVARHRLRKKLKLKRSENLTSFLANLSSE